jgi:NADPH-dependent 2,4-dienoyl-CoA reductase/sulfur reductase-like enzyme
MAYRADTWVARAEGQKKIERVQLQNGRIVPCDYLAVAWGLVPNNELAAHLGPDPSIFEAGECTGIGGVELSVVEGEIAGYTAAGRADLASQLFAARASAQKFAHALNSTFAPRAELRALAEPNTIVCRCEDVSFENLRSADCRRAAKLHFRCGMGPCQGRICGPAVQFLFGWEGDSIRPPVFPARVSSLISKKETIAQ